MVFRRDEARRCQTVGGNAVFQIQGSVAEGARIWVGKSRQPLTFDRAFFERLLAELGGRGEIRIGSKFDDPGPGSLGAWIQQDQGIAMNPAVYIAGLLVDEGYADCPRRGKIVIFPERRAKPVMEEDWASVTEAEAVRADLHLLIDRLDEEELVRVSTAIQGITEGRDEEDRWFESLRGDPEFILPTARRRSVGRFEPVALKGRPLSRDVIENRR